MDFNNRPVFQFLPNGRDRRIDNRLISAGSGVSDNAESDEMSISFNGCAGETWLYEGSGEGDHRYLEESGKTASYNHESQRSYFFGIVNLN